GHARPVHAGRRPAAHRKKNCCPLPTAGLAGEYRTETKSRREMKRSFPRHEWRNSSKLGATLPMFRFPSRFRSINKQPVSPSRVSFRPRLDLLEGRAVPSGLATGETLAPGTEILFQRQAPIQVQTVVIESSHQFGQVSLKGATIPHLTFSVDDL